MRNKPISTLSVLLMLIVFFFGSVSLAQDIKTRMIERKPAIDALKDQGIVGENNKGFLEFVGSNRAKEEMVSAENDDRQKIYNAIAKQQGTTADLVGNRRAVQIEEKGESGQWFQDSEGKWYKK